MNPGSSLADYYQRIGDPSPTNSSVSRRPVDSSPNGHDSDNMGQISSRMHSIRLSMNEKRLQMEQERKLAEDLRKMYWQDIGREAFLRVLHPRDNESDEQDDADASGDHIDEHMSPYEGHRVHHVYSHRTSHHDLNRDDHRDDYAHHRPQHYERHHLTTDSDYENDANIERESLDEYLERKRHSLNGSHRAASSSSSSSSSTTTSDDDKERDGYEDNEQCKDSSDASYSKDDITSPRSLNLSRVQGGKAYSDTSSTSKTDDEPVHDYASEKGFFISFADEKMPKVKPPPLRPKYIKAVTLKKSKRLTSSRSDLSGGPESLHKTEKSLLCSSESKTKDKMPKNNGSDSKIFSPKEFSLHSSQARIDMNECKPGQDTSLNSSHSHQSNSNSFRNITSLSNQISNNVTNHGDKTSSDEPQHQEKVKHTTPGVGFVIGTDPQSLDPVSELEMARKKEMIIMQSLRRKADTEEKLRAKKLELERKRDLERQIQEAQDKKKEEERIRRQVILEQFRMRKAAEDADKDPNSSNFSNMSSRESSRNSSTMLLSRPSRPRQSSGTKPRPKSLFVKSSDMQDCTSLDPGSSRVNSDAVDSAYSNFTSTMALNLATSKPPSRPGSSMSNANCSSVPRRLQSPTSRFPQLPTSSMLNRYRGPSSDGASDAGSTFSEYTGPKLYVKPTQKSNRGIILNAINVVLAGAVNGELKKQVLEEINNSDSKHFLILFRGAGMQFRAIYSYNPDQEEVIRLHGKGPKVVTDDMMDKFYKYNCGGRNFNEVLTKHVTVTIDAFTIHNTLWSGKRMIPSKKDCNL